MKQSTKDEILASLPQLDADALQAIVSAAKGLLAAKATPLAPVNNDPQGWLYEALTAVLQVTYPPSWHSTPTGKLFAKNAAPLLKFYDDNFGYQMGKRIAALALMRFGFEMVADHLKNVVGVPLSTGVMVRNMEMVPGCFEAQFPDYLKSGMATMIAQHILEREPYGQP
jgi:hypothetical protein